MSILKIETGSLFFARDLNILGSNRAYVYRWPQVCNKALLVDVLVAMSWYLRFQNNQ